MRKKMSTRQQLAALKRVLAYVMHGYKLAFTLVVLCIIGTVLATLRGTLFMQSLIDDYIVPLTQSQSPDFSALAAALGAGQYPVKTPGHGTMNCMAKWLDVEKQTAPIWLAFDFD